MELLLSLLSMLPSLLFSSAIFLTIVIICGLILIVILCFAIKFWFSFVHKKRPRSEDEQGQIRVGFFHPYCDAGGGGERVLWTGVRALRKRFPAAKLIVYTGDVEVILDQFKINCVLSSFELQNESQKCKHL